MARRSKAKDQTAHALKRAYERYGLRLTENDLCGLVKLIQSGAATHVVSQSLRVSVFDIPTNMIRSHPSGLLNYRDIVNVRVVYDKERKTIVTFIHNDWGFV